jgi:hypothetical protein
MKMAIEPMTGFLSQKELKNMTNLSEFYSISKLLHFMYQYTKT